MVLERLRKKLNRSTMCLLNASPLSGRKIFSQQLFHESLGLGYKSLYVDTDSFTQDIIKKMAERNWKLKSHTKNYMFIDIYSAQSNPAIADTDNIKYLASIADIAKLSNTIISGMASFCMGQLEQNTLLIFDSIDTLAMHVSPQSVYRFLYYLKAKLSTFGTLGLFVVDCTLHESKTIKMLSLIADVLIEINHDKKELVLNFMNATKEVFRYKSSERGFEL